MAMAQENKEIIDFLTAQEFFTFSIFAPLQVKNYSGEREEGGEVKL